MHNQAIHQNHKQTGMNAILIHNNFIDLVAKEHTNNQDGNEPQQTKENAVITLKTVPEEVSRNPKNQVHKNMHTNHNALAQEQSKKTTGIDSNLHNPQNPNINYDCAVDEADGGMDGEVRRNQLTCRKG
ncbi:hypothetical protein KY284_010827 [Solanum tuberosum]|nr:hypothetical protein KY284_010827 [Solanum tuberosum]